MIKYLSGTDDVLAKSKKLCFAIGVFVKPVLDRNIGFTNDSTAKHDIAAKNSLNAAFMISYIVSFFYIIFIS
jgi:hypothetical protein